MVGASKLDRRAQEVAVKAFSKLVLLEESIVVLSQVGAVYPSDPFSILLHPAVPIKDHKSCQTPSPATMISSTTASPFASVGSGGGGLPAVVSPEVPHSSLNPNHRVA